MCDYHIIPLGLNYIHWHEISCLGISKFCVCFYLFLLNLPNPSCIPWQELIHGRDISTGRQSDDVWIRTRAREFVVLVNTRLCMDGRDVVRSSFLRRNAHSCHSQSLELQSNDISVLDFDVSIGWAQDNVTYFDSFVDGRQRIIIKLNERANDLLIATLSASSFLYNSLGWWKGQLSMPPHTIIKASSTSSSYRVIEIFACLLANIQFSSCSSSRFHLYNIIVWTYMALLGLF